MAPADEQKPLPASNQIQPAQNEPKSFHEWQRALRHIKYIFLKSQYKECAARCIYLLALPGKLHPAHASYLHFYTGLCHELAARAAHNLSTLKLPLLTKTTDSYAAALSHIQAAKIQPPPDPASSPTAPALASLASSTAASFSTATASPSTPTPIPRNPGSRQTPTIPQHLPAITFAPSATSWTHARTTARYNAHATALAAMLAMHISTTAGLIADVEAAQAHRFSEAGHSRTLNGGGERRPEDGIGWTGPAAGLGRWGWSEAEREADLRARIERGRREGWVRVRWLDEARRLEGVRERAVAEW